MSQQPVPKIKTKLEGQVEDDHAAGSIYMTFSHPEYGESEYVLGLHLAEDTLAARKATGEPLTYWEPIAFAGRGTMDTDVIGLYWWLARIHSGEPDLTYAEVLKQVNHEYQNTDWETSEPGQIGQLRQEIVAVPEGEDGSVESPKV